MVVRFHSYQIAEYRCIRRGFSCITAGFYRSCKAFARYRVIDEVAEANAKEIDKDIKRDALKVFEAI